MPNSCVHSPRQAAHQGRIARGLWRLALYAATCGLILSAPADALAEPAATSALESVMVMREALAVPSPLADGSEQPARLVNLTALGSSLPLDADGKVHLRLHFDRPAGDDASALVGARVGSSCGAIDLDLNGFPVHRDAIDTPRSTRTCPRSRLIVLPGSLLREHGNQLDIYLHGMLQSQVSNIRRAAHISPVWLGPLHVLLDKQAHADLQQIGLPWLTHLGLLLLAGVVLLLSPTSRNRRRMRLYGLTVLVWSGGTSLIGLNQLLLPPAWSDFLQTCLWAPSMALAIKFMLSLCDLRSPWLRRLLILQCLMLPASLLLLPLDQRFALASTWAAWLVFQGLAAVAVFLRLQWQVRRSEFWSALAGLAAAGIVSLLDGLAAPVGLPWLTGLAWTAASPYGWATMLAIVGLRQLTAYRREYASTEARRLGLETQVRDVTAVIERNFAQLAQMRIEQLTEKERRRLASDLHDDLGAKLLTIVHTCDNERIASLGREALDEMRLLVRGLSGNPVPLSDAIADWRSETVARLRQNNIRVEWLKTGDPGEHWLVARTYVQTTRILREAVSNIIRHSQATRCRIDSFSSTSGYGLTLEDNGRGMAVSGEATSGAGRGISRMKQRAHQMNGRCEIESNPEKGTVVRLHLPLPPAD